MVKDFNKIRKTNIYYLFFMIFYSIYFTFSNLIIDNKDTKTLINLFLIILLQILIGFIFKLDFIFFITFLTTFLLLPLSMVYYNLINKSLGDLTLGIVQIHMYEDTLYVFIFIMTISLFSTIFNFNFKENKILSLDGLKLSDLSISFNNWIIIIFSVVAFPRLQISTDNRFDMLLPGHAWNQLVIVAIIFNLPYILKRKSVFFSVMFAFFWYSMNGERADISGLMLGALILVLMSKKIKKSTKIFILSIFFLLVLMLITIGTLRISGQRYGFIQTVLSIATFSTVSDISYVMNMTVDSIQNYGYTGGKLLLSIISYAIPFTSRDTVSSYINQHYPNPGGIPIISIAIMDGGGKFIAFYSFIYSLLLSTLTKFYNNKFIKYEFLILLFSIPRLSWYGINYVFPSLIFFVPFMYLSNEIINNHSKVDI